MSQQLDLLTAKIRQLLNKKGTVTLAIDGHCGAGKTTLAQQLAVVFDCNLFHMDDFFLRPEQRTAARLAEPGGNVDYERFGAEVLRPLAEGKAFSYRPYDCTTGTLRAPVPVTPKRLNIIEGSYSMHPAFADPYDLRVFLALSRELQALRIARRPAALRKRFFEEWIPMENRYFDVFSIREGCHLIWDADAENSC